MSTCDRCVKETGDDLGRYLHVEVEFLVGGRGARDERKLQASLCLACYEDVERAVTEALCVPSVHGPDDDDEPDPEVTQAEIARALQGKR